MLIIDRIEGNKAVASDGGVRVEIPVEKLPQGAGEGSILIEENGVFLLDKPAEIRRRKELYQKTARLFSNKNKE